MLDLVPDDNIFERTLSCLFPPRTSFLDREAMAIVGEYHNRLARKGVLRPMNLTPVIAIGKAQEQE